MPPSTFAASGLITYRTIMQESLPPIDWLVEGMIASDDRVIVYGESGSYKSWLLLHLGLHIAAGKRWLEEFAIPQAKGVLYVDEEMSERLLRRRIKRLGLGAELDGEDIPFQALSHGGIKLDEQGAVRLLALSEENRFNPDVIIIETMRRVIVGSELNVDDVGRFWANIEPLRLAGKTVIVSHHMRKPSQHGVNQTRYRASGSTDILGGADTVFSIMRRSGHQIEVKCEKSRNAEEPPAFGVSLHDTGADSPVEFHFEDCREGTHEPMGQMARAVGLIMQYFSAAYQWTVRTNELKAHILAQEIPKRTYERAWKEVKDSGKVEGLGGRSWQLSEQYRPMASDVTTVPPAAYVYMPDGGGGPLGTADHTGFLDG